MRGSGWANMRLARFQTCMLLCLLAGSSVLAVSGCHASRQLYTEKSVIVEERRARWENSPMGNFTQSFLMQVRRALAGWAGLSWLAARPSCPELSHTCTPQRAPTRLLLLPCAPAHASRASHT